MAELNLRPIETSIELAGLTRLRASPAGWIDCVLADFNAFLQDHASAEKSVRHGPEHGVPLPGPDNAGVGYGRLGGRGAQSL